MKEREIIASAAGFRTGDQLQLTIQGYDIIDAFNRFKYKDTVNEGYHVNHTGG